MMVFNSSTSYFHEDLFHYFEDDLIMKLNKDLFHYFEDYLMMKLNLV
jgi:hypothetical protein